MKGVANNSAKNGPLIKLRDVPRPSLCPLSVLGTLGHLPGIVFGVILYGVHTHSCGRSICNGGNTSKGRNRNTISQAGGRRSNSRVVLLSLVGKAGVAENVVVAGQR